MYIKQPARRALFYAWFVLMLLTSGTMLAGRVTSAESLGFLFMSALLIITWLKARYILYYYLNLKTAEGGWGAAFNGFLIVLLSLILGLYAIPAIIS